VSLATRLPFGTLLTVTLGLLHGHSFATAQQIPYPNFPFGVANNNTGSTTYWRSGDSPYGIYYPDAPFSFWSFRDTYLTPMDYAPGGRVNPSNGYTYKPHPSIPSFVGNTIAIVANSTNFTPAYFYGANSTPSSPKAFFQTKSANTRYWPNKAFFVGTTLYVTLSVITGAATNIGTDIARISNPTVSPTQWNIEYITLIPTNQNNSPAVALFGNEALTDYFRPGDDLAGNSAYNLYGFQGGSVLLYGYSGGKAVAIMVLNSALASTANGQTIDNSQGFRLANINGSLGWQQGLIYNNGADYANIDTTTPATGGLSGFSGYSIRYNATLGRWQLLGIPGNGGIATPYSNNVSPSLWFGTTAIGPFYTSTPLNFKFPELDPTQIWNTSIPPNFGSQAFSQTQCYGIREWQVYPNQENDSEVIFTYTTSSVASLGREALVLVDLYFYNDYVGGAPHP